VTLNVTVLKENDAIALKQTLYQPMDLIRIKLPFCCGSTLAADLIKHDPVEATRIFIQRIND
jgi:hypothetical protein